MISSVSEANLLKCMKAENITPHEKLTQAAMKDLLITQVKTNSYTETTIEALVDTLLKEGLKTELRRLELCDGGKVRELKERLCTALASTSTEEGKTGTTTDIPVMLIENSQLEAGPSSKVTTMDPIAQEGVMDQGTRAVEANSTEQTDPPSTGITCLNSKEGLESHALLKCAKCDICTNVLRNKELKFVVLEFKPNLVVVKDSLTSKQITAALNHQMGSGLNVLEEPVHKPAIASVMIKMLDSAPGSDKDTLVSISFIGDKCTELKAINLDLELEDHILISDLRTLLKLDKLEDEESEPVLINLNMKNRRPIPQSIFDKSSDSSFNIEDVRHHAELARQDQSVSDCGTQEKSEEVTDLLLQLKAALQERNNLQEHLSTKRKQYKKAVHRGISTAASLELIPKMSLKQLTVELHRKKEPYPTHSKDQSSNRKVAIKTLRSILREEQGEQESALEHETNINVIKLKRLSEENEKLKGHLANMSNSLKESYRIHKQLASLRDNDAEVIEKLQEVNDNLEAQARASGKVLKELKEMAPDTVYAINSETQTTPGELDTYEDIEAQARAANKELKELRELAPDTVYAMDSETQTGPGELGIYFDTTPSGGGMEMRQADWCHAATSPLTHWVPATGALPEECVLTEQTPVDSQLQHDEIEDEIVVNNQTLQAQKLCSLEMIVKDMSYRLQLLEEDKQGRTTEPVEPAEREDFSHSKQTSNLQTTPTHPVSQRRWEEQTGQHTEHTFQEETQPQTLSCNEEMPSQEENGHTHNVKKAVQVEPLVKADVAVETDEQEGGTQDVKVPHRRVPRELGSKTTPKRKNIILLSDGHSDFKEEKFRDHIETKIISIGSIKDLEKDEMKRQIFKESKIDFIILDTACNTTSKSDVDVYKNVTEGLASYMRGRTTAKIIAPIPVTQTYEEQNALLTALSSITDGQKSDMVRVINNDTLYDKSTNLLKEKFQNNDNRTQSIRWKAIKHGVIHGDEAPRTETPKRRRTPRTRKTPGGRTFSVWNSQRSTNQTENRN